MKTGLRRDDYMAWFKAVDEGPFYSLCCGERVHGPAMDMRLLLAAAAAATSRIEICPTPYVLPMHNATRVAKEIATLDVLCDGRLRQVSVGYGGRKQDYQAVGARFAGRHARMDRQIEEMRRVWRGEDMVAGAGPIGPAPSLAAGPKLLAGTMGPKSIERCAQWADGLYAWSFNAEKDELEGAFATADAAWERARRPHRPSRLGGCWYTLANDGQQKLYDYIYNYMAIEGHEIATKLAQSVNRSAPDRVRAALDNAEAAGCEAFFLVPATAEMVEVELLADILATR